MSELTKNQLRRLHALHAQIFGGGTPQERETARKKFDKFLRDHGKSPNDIPKLLAEAEALLNPAAPFVDPREAAQTPESYNATVSPADAVCSQLKEYLALEAHQYIAMALWAVHTHIFSRYQVTPRLALISPVKNCGKSTALDVMERLVARGEKSGHITAAAIYHAVDSDQATLLLDEADNLDLGSKAAMRSVFNNGFQKGGTFGRMMGGRRRRFNVFAPMAVASIGINHMVASQQSRCIIIHMQRYTGEKPLRRFDSNDTQELDAVWAHVSHWAREVKLNPNPDMPLELTDNRARDSWRPLIAIADACGAEWGRIARATAVEFNNEFQESDFGELVLRDIRSVFNARQIDRIASKELTKALNGMDDAPWAEWCGPHNNQPPHRLKSGELARLLAPFRIRPRVVRLSSTTTARGYHREDFEQAWTAYCPDTPSPRNKPNLTLVNPVTA